jgi:hypothetical protein
VLKTLIDVGVRIRNYFEILNVPKHIKRGHKLQLILNSMLQAPPTWNNPYYIPNAETDTIIHSCWKTITDLMEAKRKYCRTTYIFTYSQIMNVFCYYSVSKRTITSKSMIYYSPYLWQSWVSSLIV